MQPLNNENNDSKSALKNLSSKKPEMLVPDDTEVIVALESVNEELKQLLTKAKIRTANLPLEGELDFSSAMIIVDGSKNGTSINANVVGRKVSEIITNGGIFTKVLLKYLSDIKRDIMVFMPEDWADDLPDFYHHNNQSIIELISDYHATLSEEASSNQPEGPNPKLMEAAQKKKEGSGDYIIQSNNEGNPLEGLIPEPIELTNEGGKAVMGEDHEEVQFEGTYLLKRTYIEEVSYDELNRPTISGYGRNFPVEISNETYEQSNTVISIAGNKFFPSQLRDILKEVDTFNIGLAAMKNHIDDNEN